MRKCIYVHLIAFQDSQQSILASQASQSSVCDLLTNAQLNETEEKTAEVPRAPLLLVFKALLRDVK